MGDRLHLCSGRQAFSYVSVGALGVELWGLQGHERISCRAARVLQVQLWALLGL